MKKWEYKFVEVKPAESIAEVCRRNGLEGWEGWHVVAMSISGSIEHTIYFKRQLAD